MSLALYTRFIKPHYRGERNVMSRFQKPTPAEVEEYAQTIDFKVDGDEFFDFYEAKGWMIGRSPMKNWQAAVRNWKRRSKKFSRDQSTPKLIDASEFIDGIGGDK